MSAAVVIVLAFAAAVLLAGSLAMLANELFFCYPTLLRERIDELADAAKPDNNASLFKDLKQFNDAAASTRRDWRSRLRHILEQANAGFGLPAFCGVSLGCGLVAAAAACWLRRWWIVPLAGAAGILAPALYVRLKFQLRIRLLTQQLPEAFDAMSRAIRAGQTVAAAFQIIGDDFERPIADEFRRCYEEQNLGISNDTALRNLAARSGVMELRILVVALLVQSRSGGNLAELLSNLSTMVRKRVKLQQRVKALTGEGRMQAVVLICLPAVVFVAMQVVAPQYAASLLARPWLLVGAAAAQLLGAAWIRRIVSFDF